MLLAALRLARTGLVLFRQGRDCCSPAHRYHRVSFVWMSLTTVSCHAVSEGKSSCLVCKGGGPWHRDLVLITAFKCRWDGFGEIVPFPFRDCLCLRCPSFVPAVIHISHTRCTYVGKIGMPCHRMASRSIKPHLIRWGYSTVHGSEVVDELRLGNVMSGDPRL